jgi:UDP-N-acetylglucosamine 2-epimerase (non-hydrolysing)
VPGYSPTVSDLLVVVGARPNFMKAASVLPAARAAGLSTVLVHTGQHYDRELSRVFFDELGLDEPDVSLGVGSGSHATQTARIMVEFERELARIRPAAVVVVGDVNSTLACALVGRKERYPVAHVEAGLRCGDDVMPEEINRRLTDHLSTFLFATSRDAVDNLAAEGIDQRGVHFVGNTMIDTLLRFRERARERQPAAALGLDGREYALLTLHRPHNVDELDRLGEVLDAVAEIAVRVPVVFPVHPRTRKQLADSEVGRRLDAHAGVLVTNPLPYLDFVGLMDASRLVLTDSGGIQEETTVLGVPCLTLRPSTERPVTVTAGTNTVVGSDRVRIVSTAHTVLDGGTRPTRRPELWDGRAGERIAAVLSRALAGTVRS